MDDPSKTITSETNDDQRGRTPLRDTRWRARKPVPKRTQIKEAMSESQERLCIPDWYQHLSTGCGVLEDDEQVSYEQPEWWPKDWAPLTQTSHAELSKQTECAGQETPLQNRDTDRGDGGDAARDSGGNESEKTDTLNNPKSSGRAHMRYLGRRRQLSSGSVLGPKVDKYLNGISLPWTMQRSSTQP